MCACAVAHKWLPTEKKIFRISRHLLCSVYIWICSGHHMRVCCRDTKDCHSLAFSTEERITLKHIENEQKARNDFLKSDFRMEQTDTQRERSTHWNTAYDVCLWFITVLWNVWPNYFWVKNQTDQGWNVEINRRLFPWWKLFATGETALENKNQNRTYSSVIPQQTHGCRF